MIYSGSELFRVLQIVNLALIGMEKALRHVGSGELKEDNDDEREKLMIYQLEKLCINLSDLIAQVPSEYVEDSLRGVVTEIDEKAALAREEYEDVKEDLIMAQKKVPLGHVICACQFLMSAVAHFLSTKDVRICSFVRFESCNALLKARERY